MWQLRQLEKLSELEPDLVTAAVEELLQSRKTLCTKVVIGTYLEGDISLAKAAELLQEHPIQLRQKLLAQGIPVKVGLMSKEDLIAEAAAAQVIQEGSRGK